MSDAWDGRPQNPERDGWHWVQQPGDKAKPHFWYAWPGFFQGVISGHQRQLLLTCRYLGPCIEPPDHTRLTARVAKLEALLAAAETDLRHEGYEPEADAIHAALTPEAE